MSSLRMKDSLEKLNPSKALSTIAKSNKSPGLAASSQVASKVSDMSKLGGIFGNMISAIGAGSSVAQAFNEDTDSNYSAEKEAAQDNAKKKSVGSAIGTVASIILSILAL